MTRFVVIVQRIPTNYNQPESYVVEAASESDARTIVRDHLRDLASLPNYTYLVTPYVPPPAGKILHHPTENRS